MTDYFHLPLRPKGPGLCIVLAISLAGCAGSSGQFPSFEVPTATSENGRVSMYFENVQATQAIDPEAVIDPLPAEFNAKVAAIKDRATRASLAFADEAETVSALARAATGADVTSDRWAVAQVSLADLTSHHSEAHLALADLDFLIASAETNLAEEEMLNELRASQADIAATLDDQAQILIAINARLAR